MISKELLSEVLGWKEAIKGLLIDNEVIGVEKQLFQVSEYRMNVYEVAHKCKEWALDISGNSHRYCIISYTETNRYGVATVDGVDFTADTEPEAIIKACQWIKDNKC